MARYVLIESRDPLEASEVAGYYYDLAAGLAKDGNDVTLFLVQNGVMPARFGARADKLASIVRSGVKVLADEFSLRERAIPRDRLATGVAAAPLDFVVDQMAAGSKVIWH